MRSASSSRRVRLLAGLLTVPLLAGCFASPDSGGGSGAGQSGARLRVALAFPPAENLSPYGADATILSRLGVTEGLTALDANGAAVPALAASWQRANDRTWVFTLREARFQDGTDVSPAAVAASLTPDIRRETATTRTTSLLLNTEKGPFEDPALRAAARAAVDTAALADGVYEGHADPGAGICGPAVTWAEGKRRQPVGRAGAADPDGTSITLATYDNRPELPETAQVLKQQLEQAGFTVRLEVREYSRLESDALAGKFDAFVGARNSLVDTGDPVAVLASDHTCDGGYNLALLCDKAVDRAVERAEAVADPAARQDAVMAAEARILGTDAVVPLVHQRVITGVGKGVRGVLLDPYERTLVGTGTRR